jgi:hypothetical protein
MDLPILLLIAAAAGGTALAVFLRTDAGNHGTGNGAGSGSRTRASHAHRPGVLAGAADIIDASIGMYLVRKALGRSTSTRAEGRAERARVALAAAEEDRRRAGVLGPAIVAPTRLVVAGTAASHSPRDLPDRQAHPVAPRTVVPTWTRRASVSREATFAAAVVVVAVAAFAIWPRNEGGVLSVTGTPAPPSPTADVSSQTAVPSDSPSPTAAPAVASATPSPTTGATPTPTPTATATATATVTPRPTARPTNTPRPTARQTAKPTATPKPTAAPTPTPDPTPDPTPEPTPDPTPAPTPDPTPAPTPEPTPEPTPTPAFSAT